jgi:hypothetical protein
MSLVGEKPRAIDMMISRIDVVYPGELSCP